MALPKQVVQFFFGATDQDTSAKGVKTGDVVIAQNIQQLHGGELIKRGGFEQSLESYDGATCEPDSLVSPDGAQTIIHDADTDSAFVATGDTESTGLERSINQSQGASLRLMATTQVRFPASETDTQAAPMCKQAGDYFVFLVDESHIRVARKSTDGSSVVDDSGSVAVVGPAPEGGGPHASTHIKSFAVVNTDDFDDSYLWVFWVDWSTNAGAQQNRDGVWAVKFSKADLTTYSFYNVAHGGEIPNLCLTSISASIVGNGNLVVAQVGNIGHGGTWIDFRTACSSVDWHAQHFYFDKTGTRSQIGYKTNVCEKEFNWCASGCCILTQDDVASFVSGSFRYAFWCNSDAYQDHWMLTVATIPEDFSDTGKEGSGSYLTVSAIKTDEDLALGHGMALGSVTGYETAAGAMIVAQFRHYLGTGLVDPFGAYTCDRLYTMGFNFTGSLMATPTWTARGAWLAHGWFEWTDGTKCVITGYEDPDALQVPYHLRNAETGQILAQFSYGEGPHAGGTATSTTQVTGHWNDLNQPMIQGDSATSPHDNVVLATQSANVTGTTDIVSVTIEKPSYQNPASWGNMAIAPGPIPTIVNGWQKVTEAGPLVAPPRFLTCYGTGNT